MSNVVLLSTLLLCCFVAAQAWDRPNDSINSDNGYAHEIAMWKSLHLNKQNEMVEVAVQDPIDDEVCEACTQIVSFVSSSFIKQILTSFQTTGCSLIPMFSDMCQLIVRVAITMDNSPGVQNGCKLFDLCKS